MSQVAFDHGTGKYTLSNQVFAPLGPGISVNVASLYEAAQLSDEDRVKAQDGFGAVRVSVEKVRATATRDKDGKPNGKFAVAYTPLSLEHGPVPDPYHGDIFPRSTGASNRDLTKQAVAVVEVDQELAAAALAKRHG